MPAYRKPAGAFCYPWVSAPIQSQARHGRGGMLMGRDTDWTLTPALASNPLIYRNFPGGWLALQGRCHYLKLKMSRREVQPYRSAAIRPLSIARRRLKARRLGASTRRQLRVGASQRSAGLARQLSPTSPENLSASRTGARATACTVHA
jgi:hypothetical protein